MHMPDIDLSYFALSLFLNEHGNEFESFSLIIIDALQNDTANNDEKIN